jgi:hypothetical protein
MAFISTYTYIVIYNMTKSSAIIYYHPIYFVIDLMNMSKLKRSTYYALFEIQRNLDWTKNVGHKGLIRGPSGHWHIVPHCLRTVRY